MIIKMWVLTGSDQEERGAGVDDAHGVAQEERGRAVSERLVDSEECGRRERRCDGAATR